MEGSTCVHTTALTVKRTNSVQYGEYGVYFGERPVSATSTFHARRPRPRSKRESVRYDRRDYSINDIKVSYPMRSVGV